MIARPPPSTSETAAQQDARGGSPWHTVGPDTITFRLETGPHGLSQDEARRRLDRDGPNELAETPPTSPFVILLHQFRSPLIYILLGATLVTLLLEEFIDAGVIATVLALNAVIGYTQERRAEQSVRALMRLMAPKAHVVRGGREWSIDSRDLVAGDVVLLESGARVPADLRLFSTTALRVDESLLESIRGGAETETPLQHRMKRFAHVVGIVVFLSASAAFAIGVSLGAPPAHMFMVAVALAVAAVPEGLPVVFTVTLALAVRRMARRNAIVRRLPAVETLGSTTVIGSDKTGTITENRMTVQEVWAGGQTMTVGGSGLATLREPPVLARATPHDLTVLAGVLTNEAELYRQNGTIETQGDPTEAALLVAAAAIGLEPEAVRGAYPSIEELPFEPDRQYSASERATDGQCVMFVKGAPERLLDMSTRLLGTSGVEPLDGRGVLRAAAGMASRGLRVLGMAYRPLPDAPSGGVVPSPEALTFVGLQGMLDPRAPGCARRFRGARPQESES